MQKYELVIIGAGMAGLTAAIYARRGNISTLLLEGAFPGGQCFTIDLVENWPGFPDGVKGGELIELVQKQAEKLGIKMEAKMAMMAMTIINSIRVNPFFFPEFPEAGIEKTEAAMPLINSIRMKPG